MAKCDVCGKSLPEGTEGICPECLYNETEIFEYEIENGETVIVRPLRKKIPWNPKWNIKEEHEE